MKRKLLLLALLCSVPAFALADAPARSVDVLNRFGINTHLDFQKYGYQHIAQTAADINYLGGGQISILRDSPGSSSDLSWWPQLAAATGAKFDAYIGEGAPDIYSTELSTIKQMYASGGNYLMGVEGGNEEDDAYPTSLGNSQYLAARFQPTLFSWAQSAGLPIFNISFGAGWCGAQDPTCTIGDYGTAGDLSAHTTYGNAHAYPQYSPQSTGAFSSISAAAKLAASSRPVAITEYGWTTNTPGGFGNVSEQAQAAYVLEGILDAYKLGATHYFYYALYDDASGTFGLFKTSGEPKPAALALHNFFLLLGDNAGATNTALGYSLSGMPTATSWGSGGRELLLQKSDGSYWLALWNEQSLNTQGGADVAVAATPVVLTLATPADMSVYDPLVGTVATQSASGTRIAIAIPAHPILIKIVPPGTAPTNSSPSSSAPTTTPSTASNIGQRVAVAQTVNVRSGPSTSNSKLGHQINGSLGTIIGGPVVAGGHTWLDISYDEAPSGWSAAEYLNVLDAAPTPPPAPTPTPSTPLPAPAPTTALLAAPSATIPPVDTPHVTAPTNLSVSAQSATVVSGVSVADPFGAANPGLLALDASAQNGTLVLAGANGSGSKSLTYNATLAGINSATLLYTPDAGASDDTITIIVYNQAGIYASRTIPVKIIGSAPAQPTLSLPTTLNARVGAQTHISNVSVVDPFAAHNPGTMSLRINADSGTLSAPNTPGSGTKALSLDGTLAEVNAALAGLAYTATSAGSDSITVSIWNQAGLHTDKTISVSAE